MMISLTPLGRGSKLSTSLAHTLLRNGGASGRPEYSLMYMGCAT